MLFACPFEANLEPPGKKLGGCFEQDPFTAYLFHIIEYLISYFYKKLKLKIKKHSPLMNTQATP